jgi:beta-galactosidase
MSLHSASGPVALLVGVDRTNISVTGNDLAFVDISLVDDDANIYNTADRLVTVRLDGPGMLQGLGSASPVTDEGFLDDVHTTFDGRALAVVRPTGPGLISITVSADGCEPVTVTTVAESPIS